MSKKTVTRDARSHNSRRNVVKRELEGKERMENLEAFVAQRFPDVQAEDIKDDTGNVIGTVKTFDVTSFSELFHLMSLRYPSEQPFDVVAMANAAWQKAPFNPSESAKAAPTKMREAWDAHYREATTALSMRERVDDMRQSLFEIANHTLVDVAFYGYPSPRDNERNENAGKVLPNSTVDLIRSCELATIVNCFLNWIRHDITAVDSVVLPARDYINAILDNDERPYRILSVWWEGDPPKESRKWQILNGVRVPTKEVLESIRPLPCLIPEYVDKAPKAFADALKMLIDPTDELPRVVAPNFVN